MADGQHGEDLERGAEEIPLSSAKFVRADDISLDLRSYFPKFTKDAWLHSGDKENPIKIIDIAILSSGKLGIVTNSCCTRYTLYDGNRYNALYREEKQGQLVGVVSTVGPKMGLLGTYMNGINDISEIFNHVTVLSKERIIAVKSSTNIKNLTMLSVSGQNISVIKSIRSMGCYDISCVDNKFVFGYREGVGIWNIGGGTPDLPKSVTLPGIGRTHIVHKISAVMEGGLGVVYIYCKPCFGCNIITKMSLNGDIFNTFNNLEFTDAGEICATGDGHLFMSFPEENCIRVLLPDMSKAVKVVENVKPSGICYCQETRRLFVVNNEDIDNPCIQVFEIQ